VEAAHSCLHMKNMRAVVISFLLLMSLKSYAQLPMLYPNFPVLIDSNFTGSGSYVPKKTTIPLITDLEKDGQKEIVTSVNGTAGSKLFVIRSDGYIYPGFPKSFAWAPTDFASGDVDGNGYLEIVLRFLNRIEVLDRFGNNLPGFPVTYFDGITQTVSRFVSLYDLDNDGKLEIIVNKNNEVAVFDFRGQFRNGWPKYVPGAAYYNPAIGDLDGDGFAEIIIPTFKINPVDSSYLNVFRHDGIIFSDDWPVRFDSNYISWSASPSLFVSDNSQDSTFICVPCYRTLYEPPSPSVNKLLKFDVNGNVIAFNFQITWNDLGTLVMGDINADGDIELASGTQDGGFLTVYDKNLNIMSGWPQQGGGGQHFGTVAIGKIEQGGHLGIISNRWLTTIPYGYVFAHSGTGSQYLWSPIHPIGIVRGVSFTDLNSDGNTELVATGVLGNVFGIVRVYVYAYTFPGIPFTPENFPWPMYGHDRYRTNQYGFIPPDEPIGIKPVSEKVPDVFRLQQNYPNPFNASTRIMFDISGKSSVRLAIYDVLGREISVLINETLNAGAYTIDFDGTNYSSGIYFCKIQTRNERAENIYNSTIRMILIK
jgi:hypothetical protein